MKEDYTLSQESGTLLNEGSNTTTNLQGSDTSLGELALEYRLPSKRSRKHSSDPECLNEGDAILVDLTTIRQAELLSWSPNQWPSVLWQTVSFGHNFIHMNTMF